MSLIVTALTTILLALSLAGVVAGGVKSGGAMSRYSSGIRQTAEDFQNVDLDQVQADQRTAPLEVAQGLGEAAMSAQTIGSPDVAANPVGMGFTDGMSIGQLAVGYAEDSSAEDSSADEEGDESEDVAENGAEDGSASGDTGSSGQAGTQGADTGEPVEQAAPTYYVAWYADNIGFRPIWISSVETYREESIASHWPGGGLDPNVKLVKVAITGAFKTETEALEAVASQLSNKRIAGGIYAGMPLADIGGETHDVEYINWQSFWE